MCHQAAGPAVGLQNRTRARESVVKTPTTCNRVFSGWLGGGRGVDQVTGACTGEVERCLRMNGDVERRGVE